MNLVSAFDFFLAHNTNSITDEAKKQEAYDIFVEESLDDFLGFLLENNFIDKLCYEFMTYDLFLYELGEDNTYLNYYEEDYDKQVKLLNKVFDNNVEKYAKKHIKETKEL